MRLTDDEWRLMLATHLDDTFYGTRAAIGPMLDGGGGAIINLASICAVAGCAGTPHYSAAKAGIVGFTRSVAKELVVHGIRVNAIAPGFVETPMLEALSSDQRATREASIPMGRLGLADEVASAAVFLAGDEASYVVGEMLNVNGGYLTT